ncbi:hypothetical protein [Arhodomonas sp. SL1]|uniref:hypothetical protein n=1 Tax=Arhodomonas sp. SL1 TaxID=3425691 RepID=UPI003F8836CF
MVRFPLLVGLLVAALVITACANSESTRQRHTEPGSLPSDYDPTDPESQPEGGMIPTLGELIGLDRPSRPGEVGPEARALEQEIAQLRADIRAQGGGSARRGAAGEERGGPGIALVFPGATDLASTRAYSVMGPVAGEYPLQAVNPQSFRRALEAAGCGAEALTECGRDVTAASGVRMVALIEGTEPRGGQLPLSVTLVDLDLGVEHPGYTIELPATDEGTAEESLAALADSVYLHAIERLRLAPVIHHVRPAGDGRWILDPRGRRYDAEARFTVHRDGRVLEQAGEAVAWIPDEPVGALSVVDETPNGLLVLERVDGQAPRPTDLVLPARR